MIWMVQNDFGPIEGQGKKVLCESQKRIINVLFFRKIDYCGADSGIMTKYILG
jgi:hypothetical protein